jgi:hypothetical protein
MKIITMQFELTDEEYGEFLDQEEVNGNLREWVFGEICQNQGFGFLTSLTVEDSE